MATPASTTPIISDPPATTMFDAGRLSRKEDKPIYTDYWDDSQSGQAVIGIKSNQDKHLWKSDDVYTSKVLKICKSSAAGDLLVITENSIYVVASGIGKKRLNDTDF